MTPGEDRPAKKSRGRLLYVLTDPWLPARLWVLDLAAANIMVADSNPVAYGAGSSVSGEGDDLIYEIDREYDRVEAIVWIRNANAVEVYERRLMELTNERGEQSSAWDKKDGKGELCRGRAPQDNSTSE